MCVRAGERQERQPEEGRVPLKEVAPERKTERRVHPTPVAVWWLSALCPQGHVRLWRAGALARPRTGRLRGQMPTMTPMAHRSGYNFSVSQRVKKGTRAQQHGEGGRSAESRGLVGQRRAAGGLTVLCRTVEVSLEVHVAGNNWAETETMEGSSTYPCCGL